MYRSPGRGKVVLIATASALLLVAAISVSIYLLSRGGGEGPDGQPAGLAPGEGNEPLTEVDAGEEDLQPGKVAADMESTAEAEKTSAPGGEERGPPSIEGTIRNAAGEGVQLAVVIALNSDDWDEATREIQNKMNSSQDPREVFRLLSETYRQRLAGLARTKSGENGAYRFYGLKPANYRLLVTHEEHLSRTDVWVEVVRGETAKADVELVQGYSIGGTVVDGKGKGIGGARIQATPSSEVQKSGFGRFLGRFLEMLEGSNVMEGDSPASGPDGGFRLTSLQPVPYDLLVSRPGYAEGEAHRVPAGAQGVVVVLLMGKSISARVVDPELRPVEGAEWEIQPALPKNAFDSPLILMQEDIDLTGEKLLRGKTGGDGRLEISGLKGGAHDLQVKARGFPVEKFRLNIAGEGQDLGDLKLQDPFAISGRVLDPDGRPVEGARVWVPRPPAEGESSPRGRGIQREVLAEARTDAGGKYVLEPLPKGSLEVHASTEDLAEASVDGVEAGSKGIDIRLSPGISVDGKVLDRESQEPIPQARIAVMSERYGGNRTAVTDAEGLFSIRGIAAGGIGAGRPGGDQPTSVFIQVTHPDYASEFRSIPLAREAGAPPEEILLSRRKSIQGVVVDAEGVPIHLARVRLEIPGVPEIALMLNSGGTERKVFSARDGTFQLDLPGREIGRMGGNLELVASHPAHATGRIPIEALKLGDGTYGRAEIVLPPGVAITGKVTDGEGRPLAGAQLRLERAMAGAGEEALLLSAMMPGKIGRTAYAGADGSYRVGAVEPGKYVLQVQAAGYAGKRIDVAVEDRPVTQDVVLDAGGSIAGLVKDGEGRPVAGVEVVAFLDIEQPESREIEELAMFRAMTGTGSAQARTSEDGSYSLTHLPEGQYTIAARGKGFVPAVASGLKPGDRPPDLILQRLAGLRVRVVAAATGRPVNSYSLRIEKVRGEGGRDLFDNYFPPEEVEDGNGEYSRENLNPGTFLITVKASGFAETTVKAEVLGGRENRIPIRLEPGFRAEILVFVAETGQPIQGASVSCGRLRNEGELDSITSRQSIEFRTDEGGLASSDSFSPGKYMVHVSQPLHYPARESYLNLEFPRDSGSRFEFPMNPGGRIKGKIGNIPPPDPNPVSYQLTLRPAGDAVGAKDAEKSKKSKLGEERTLWVNTTDGSFEGDSLRPGKYTILLRVTRYRRLENGGMETLPGSQEPLELGTVEVRAGEVEELKLQMP